MSPANREQPIEDQIDAIVTLLRETSFDLAGVLDVAAWSFVATQFQKRHLLAHKLGIIDADHIKKQEAPYLGSAGRSRSPTLTYELWWRIFGCWLGRWYIGSQGLATSAR